MKAFLKSTTPISARIFGVIGTVLAGQLTEANVPSPIRGATIYSLCSTCHGPKGEGVHKLETPPLTGLSTNYVESQLRKFRDGRRGAHHADVKGLMMRAMARVLIRDEDLVAVSKFVGSLPSDLTDQTQQPKPPNRFKDDQSWSLYIAKPLSKHYFEYYYYQLLSIAIINYNTIIQYNNTIQ